MYDFKDVVLPFSVFFILEKLVEKLLFDPLTTICKEQNDKQAQAKRTKKMVANVFKFFYYSFVSVLGFYILIDHPQFTNQLGGNGHIKNLF